MKLAIPRNDLVDLLARTGKIIASRNTIPVLNNVMLEARAGALKVTSNNLDMEVTAELAAAVETPGATTVTHAVIDCLARGHAKGAEIVIEVAEQMLVRCGRSCAKLLTQPADTFPSLEAGEWTTRFALPCAELRRMIACVTYAICEDVTRYYLQGALLCIVAPQGGEQTEPRLCMVATNGVLFASTEAPCPAGAETLSTGEHSIIIPKAALAELARLAKSGEGDVALAFNTRKLRAAFADGTTILSKLIEGTYPDWRRMVAGVSTGVCAIVDKDALEATLARIAPIVNRTTHSVTLTIAPDLLTLTAASPEAGDIHEEIACEADGTWSGDMQSVHLATTLASVPADTVDILVGTGMAMFVHPHGRRDPMFLMALRR
jgi:DNA polymerase-3 subunit beta